jgi:hypothetical protein
MVNVRWRCEDLVPVECLIGMMGWRAFFIYFPR